MKPYLVGITGGSASGKTLLLQKLLSAFEENEICLVSQDNYYKDQSLQPLDDNGIPNYDQPESIDQEKFKEDLKKIKSGASIEIKEYTFNNPNREACTVTCKPAPIIIAEGIFIFYYEALAKQFDLKIFLDAQEHIKLKRRIARDQKERGYNVEDVLYRYEHHVSPTYKKYIEPFKEEADLIIPNNKHLDKALEVLIAFLKHKIHGK
ncbi:uridine kinase [Cytophagaceae bacterium ABcell3]|nr:uridine kinase [Cytophagaceae bacterium ABcell3]